MLSLSTYVGLAKVSVTYWYMSAVPQMMALAAGRFESFTSKAQVQAGQGAKAMRLADVRRDVTSLHDVERALAVPMKRFERPMLGFLTRAEMVEVLGQPEQNWSSQRDHLLLAMLYNTGARVSEIIAVRACTCTARVESFDQYRCGRSPFWRFVSLTTIGVNTIRVRPSPHSCVLHIETRS